jgi:hypothetical protein
MQRHPWRLLLPTVLLYLEFIQAPRAVKALQWALAPVDEVEVAAEQKIPQSR